MATYSFEQITEAQALAYNAATDSLVMSLSGPDQVSATYTDSTITVTATVFDGRTVVRTVTFGLGVAGERVVVNSSPRVLVIGGGGAESFVGGSSLDVLLGGPGADTLNGLASNDQLFGGDGDDVLIGSEGPDRMTGGAGNDTFLFPTSTNLFTRQHTITDWSSGDRLSFGATGGAYVEVVAADYAAAEALAGNLILQGARIVAALAGGEVHVFADDTRNGGFLEWSVNLGRITLDDISADRVGAETTLPTIVTAGTAGADTFKGTGGGDTFNGLAGDDVLRGGGGDDSLAGGAGADTIEGGAGADRIQVTSDADRILGGPGIDAYVGLAANTTFVFAAGDAPLDDEEDFESLSGWVSTNRMSFGFAGPVYAEGEAVTYDGAFRVATSLIAGGAQVVTVSVVGGVIVFADTLRNGGGPDDGVFIASTNLDQFSGLTFAAGATLPSVLGPRGTDGPETFPGTAGEDSIWAGGGDDLILSSGGVDFFDGRAGNDTLSYAGETHPIVVNLNDRIAENPADEDDFDYLNAIEGVIGTAFNDSVVGTTAAETLSGADGADAISGGGGADLILGGASSDGLSSGSSSATLVGGDGNDVLSGSSGRAFGEGGNDLIVGALFASGGDGDDTLSGTTVDGGAGNDRITSGTLIIGGDGDDTIDGGAGGDDMTGGAGADRFVIGLRQSGLVTTVSDAIRDWSTEDTMVFSNLGQDALSYRETTAGTLAQAISAAEQAFAEGVNIVAVEQAGNVYIFADTGNDNGGYDDAVLLFGRSLADVSAANFGGIAPYTSAPPQTRSTNSTGQVLGNMDLANLAVIHTAVATSFPPHLSFAAPGVSANFRGTFTFGPDGRPTSGTLETADVTVPGLSFNLDGFANFMVGALFDSLRNGDSLGALAAIYSRDDRITGGSTFDLIRGFAGNDLITGGAASNTIYGGAGNDAIYGTDQNLALNFPAAYNFLRGEEGDDFIVGGTGFDDMHGNMGQDTLGGGPGDDWVVGGQGNDILFGDSGDDLVLGNLGLDTVIGADGNDVIRGGQAEDSLSGGAGNDFLSGDRGDDTLSGGTGADMFNAFGEAGTDRVIDFNAGEGDRVRLEPGSTFTTRQSGADTVVDVTGGAQVVLVGVTLESLPAGWIFVS